MVIPIRPSKFCGSNVRVRKLASTVRAAARPIFNALDGVAIDVVDKKYVVLHCSSKMRGNFL